MKDLFHTFPALATPRRALGMTLAVGALATMIGGGTLAYFTTQATSTDNVFSAGSLDLAIGNATDPTSNTVTATFNASNRKPGDTVYAPLFLKNNGTLGLTYTATFAATDSGSVPANQQPPADAHLGQFLNLKVYRLNLAQSDTCATGGLAHSADLTAGGALLGDASGGLSGALISSDQPLAASGGQDSLCVVVDFANGAAGAENSGQGGTSTVGLTFSGKQS